MRCGRTALALAAVAWLPVASSVPVALRARPAVTGFRAWVDGDTPTAVACFRLDTGRDGRHNLATALLDTSNPVEAESLTLGLLGQHRNWLPATRLAGRVQRARGGSEATATAARLISTRGATSRDCFWAASVFLEQGQLRDAVAAFTEATRREPDSYLGWLALGDAHAAAGEATEAGAAWQRAASLCRTSDVLMRLGRAALVDGHREVARGHFTEALRRPGGEPFEDEVTRLLPEQASEWRGAVRHGRPAPVWHPGEVLRYSARFLGIPLGRVELSTTLQHAPSGERTYRLRMTAATHPGYFFFRARNQYESVVAEDGTFLTHLSQEDDSTTRPTLASYEVDRARGVCTWRYAEDGLIGVERLPQLPLGQDGLSILVLAREAARTGRSYSAPTLANGAWKGTDIDVRGTERITWAGREVQAVRVDVVAHFKGAAGVSGTSTTWYSADAASVPLKSAVKLALGSITLELIDR